MDHDNLSPGRLPLPPGLGKALWNVPSLIVPIWAAYAGLELVSQLLSNQIPEITIETFQILAATLIGVILYSIGDFWDTVFFDKMYSVDYPNAAKADYETIREGIWLQREKRPLGIYPAGLPLKIVRDKFVQSDKNLAQTNGYGSYRFAKRKLQAAGTWGQVENPLLISKFMRSFIWPFTLIAILSLCYYLWISGTSGVLTHPSGLIFLFCTCIAILATVPYCKFRVEHLTSLYETGTEPGQQENLAAK